MSILDQIKEQPQHVREIMFGLSVVITVSLIGAVWLKDIQKDMYALLNPEEVQQERFLADNEGSDSLFSVLGKTLGDISSSVSTFWNSDGGSNNTGIRVENKAEDKVYLLPLSEQK